MEKDAALYWKTMKLWTVTLILCFILASTTGLLFREVNPEIIIPVCISILFFPLIITGLYGLKSGYSMSHCIGYIYRGSVSTALNFFVVALYFCILLFTIFGKGIT